MKHPGVIMKGAALLGLLFVAACGEAYDTQAIREMPVSGDLFHYSLHSQYVVLAENRWDRFDWRGTKHFNAKAKAAALGKTVLPDQPDGKDIPPPLQTTLSEAHKELTKLLSAKNVLYNPIDAAEIQTSFDCWVREAQDGDEETDGDTCRDRFEEAVDHLESHLKVVTVVLLPNFDGTVGTIEVISDTGRITLNRAGQATQLTAADTTPIPPFNLDGEEIQDQFGPSLDAHPNPPVKFILYFKPSSSELTDQSRSLLKDILMEVSNRDIVQISVIGHTDRVSSDAYNRKLSLQRAHQVTETLVNQGINADLIDITSHGESNPLIPTSDDVAESRNRRVEVVVR